jgi:hypothetical protein
MEKAAFVALLTDGYSKVPQSLRGRGQRPRPQLITSDRALFPHGRGRGIGRDLGVGVGDPPPPLSQEGAHRKPSL